MLSGLRLVLPAVMCAQRCSTACISPYRNVKLQVSLGSVLCVSMSGIPESSKEVDQQLCSNCKCQPVLVGASKCGFDDWCERCDLSLYRTRLYDDLCVANRHPHPPSHPLSLNGNVCPCGFFAIRNRTLAQPGKENLPLHLLVTIPITAHTHVTVCLICDTVFKRHRNGLKHLRQHHQHFHVHH
jgi:hypothetical protein